MAENTHSSAAETQHNNTKNENDHWNKLLLALLFLLLSFFCVFCASQSALFFINRDEIQAGMLSSREPDYSSDPFTIVAAINPDIEFEAQVDSERLRATRPPAVLDDSNVVAIAPRLPTPIPEPTVAVLLPTATALPTPTRALSTPTAKLPTATSVATSGPPPTESATPIPPTSEPATPVPTIAPTVRPSPTVVPTTLPSPTPIPVPSPTPIPPTPVPPTDTPPEPVVSFVSSSFVVNEGNGTATITAILDIPAPSVTTVNFATGNGTALAGSDYTATSGVMIFATGQITQTISVPIIPDFVDEVDETVVLALSAPTNASLGTPNVATLTILDDDAPPAVQFTSTTYAVAENGSAAIVTATLTNASVFTVTVDYATNDGSALAVSDYRSQGGTLSFPPGNTLQTFTVPITDDLIYELAETVSLSLLPPINNATFGSPTGAALTIVDNEVLPTVQFDSSAYSVFENAGPAVLTTTLSGASALTVTVDYLSTDLTAQAGTDYLTATGAITFAPGQLLQTFTVPITDDLPVEPNETLQLTLSNPTNSNIGSPNPAILTIIEDVQPTIQFESGSYTVGEVDGSALITVTLSTPSLFVVTADYASTNISALAGSDYLTATGVLTLTPGTTVTTFTVPILDDLITNEISETVSLTLNNSNNALLGTPNPATLTIVDDDGSPTVSFVQTFFSVNEEDDGGTGFVTTTVGVALSAPSALPVMVNYLDAGGGTATPVSDYVSPFDNVLTFNPGETGKGFDVVIVNDVTTDPVTETLNLSLATPTNATLGTAAGTLVIVDNEPVGPPCTGTPAAGEPDEGPPDGNYLRLDCGSAVVITLTTPISTSGNSNFDFVFYEIQANPHLLLTQYY